MRGKFSLMNEFKVINAEERKKREKSLSCNPDAMIDLSKHNHQWVLKSLLHRLTRSIAMSTTGGQQSI
jgi:hypothetical protein